MENNKSSSDKKLKILFLTARFPYPVIGGDRLKPHNIISYLAKKHDVTLVSFFHGGTPPKSYVREVEKLGVRLVTVPLYPAKAGLNSLKRLFTKYPLEILFYLQPEYKKTIDALIETENFDLAVAFFMRTAEYLKEKPIKKILMAEDCRTLYQKRSYEQSENLKQKIVRYWEYKKLSGYEPEVPDYFDITTFVTKVDISEMTKLNPNAQYRLLTNGTDLEKFTLPEENTKRRGILFAGKLDVWANQLMIRDIVHNIFPKINKNIPDAELNIVGAKPPQSIQKLAGKNINIISDVPEMQPYLQKAQLFLHPHNGGTGIQNKLLEAMACGCPVVTTPTGNQGIDGTSGTHLMIGKNQDELARHAIRILKDQDLAMNISANARKLIEETHSWEIIFRDTDRIIEGLFNQERPE
ncbi:MAG: glycosyltransferase [Candidatus Kapaibacterium sp.]